jgi:putative glutathione S-transferase
MAKENIGNTWEKQIDEDGAFVRRPTSFHGVCSTAVDAEFPAEAGRYHLYVSYACPWAHRTLIVRALKGLEEAISVDVVHHLLTGDGWSFDTDIDGATGDRVNGFDYLKQAYFASNPDYEGSITVPVLWDKHARRIVNNESSEIIRILNSAFQAYATHPEVDLYPEPLRPQIDELNSWIYPQINNGVYRCGFARSQRAYSAAFESLFVALDQAEEILSRRRFLTGNTLTEADVRLFTTLVRFDPVYLTHFKTNKHRLIEYPSLWGFVRDIYQMPGIAETVNMEHIKRHYFESHRQINPFGIVPDGPELDLEAPTDRGRFSSKG